MLRRLFFFLICFSLCSFAQNKHPFTFDDMMQLKRVGEPVVSPDSKWVAFSAVDVNLDANTRKPHLWIVPLITPTSATSALAGDPKTSGAEARRLTPATGAGEDRVRFSP